MPVYLAYFRQQCPIFTKFRVWSAITVQVWEELSKSTFHQVTRTRQLATMEGVTGALCSGGHPLPGQAAPAVAAAAAAGATAPADYWVHLLDLRIT